MPWVPCGDKVCDRCARIRRFHEHAQGVIDACFSRRAAWVDNRGNVLGVREKHNLHSRDMAEWCRQSPNHYIGWSEQDFGDGNTVVGIRAL
jgi:hypothetical protein